MRRVPALPALLALGAAISCDLTPTDAEIRTGMTLEELNSPPSSHQVKAAIITDVRIWRQLDLRLDEGKKICEGIVFVEGEPTCARDQELLEVYVLKSDLPDQAYRVDEAAYFCRLEGIYHYHYVGGPKKLDVWLGPYKLVRRAVRPDERELQIR
jgi:hypothetical protein